MPPVGKTVKQARSSAACGLEIAIISAAFYQRPECAKAGKTQVKNFHPLFTSSCT
jgi:hypothetical protein